MADNDVRKANLKNLIDLDSTTTFIRCWTRIKSRWVEVKVPSTQFVEDPTTLMQFLEKEFDGHIPGRLWRQNGMLHWDTDVEGVTLTIGEEMYVPDATNKTGVIIPNGTVVYIDGAQGSNATVSPASAADPNSTHKLIGMTTSDIPHNGHGKVTVFGLVRGLNTDGSPEGSNVFLGITPGSWTDVMPSLPNITARIGTVIYEHLNQGIILCSVMHSNYFHSLLVGNLEGGNYTTIDDEGFQVFYGNGRFWDDLRFPANAINPVGLAGAASIEASGTFIGCLLFDSALTEICAGQAQLPHSWDEGTSLKPHVHWTPTSANAGTVHWLLEYQIASPLGVFPGVYTSLEIDDASDGADRKHQIAPLGEIPMTDETLSCMIVWKLSRVGVSDTYPDDARLLEFDIHYRGNTHGSKLEFTK